MGRADLHCHTYLSGINKYLRIPFPESVTPPEKMVDKSIKKKFDVLCITDHNSIEGAYRAQRYAVGKKLDIEVVVGEEITTSDGELLGLFIQEHIEPGLTAEDTIDCIREQGGLAVAPHPYSYHCPSLGEKIRILDLDGIEILNGFHRDPYVNRLADKFFETAPMAKTGGSDAHSRWMLGTAYTEFMGKTADDLYAAIKRRETTPGGEPVHLRNCVLWSMEIPYAVIKTLLKPGSKKILDPQNPLERVTQMKKRNKAFALFGCMIYLVSPLPYICGVMSEGVSRYKGRKKWYETMTNM